MTTVVISQPMLFPWPGFFEQRMLADVFIHLDDAQFSKGSFTNRVQLKAPGGRTWLTVPLAGRGSFRPIRELDGVGDWRTRHRTLLARTIAGAPYAADALAQLDAAYAKPRLVDALIASIEAPAGYLGLKRPETIVRASELGVTGASWQRVLALVEDVGGTRYVTGHGAAGYLDHAAFEARGIAVEYMDYSLTPWPQRHGAFSPHVSVLDLIADLGPAGREVLQPKTTGWRAFLARQTSTRA
jgi:hypothetical protein